MKIYVRCLSVCFLTIAASLTVYEALGNELTSDQFGSLVLSLMVGFVCLAFTEVL